MSLLITKAKLMEIIYEEIEEALDPHRSLAAQAGDEYEYEEPEGDLPADLPLARPAPSKEEPDPYPIHPSPQAMAMAMDWYRVKNPKKYKNFIRDKGPQHYLDHIKRSILRAAREIDAAKKKPTSPEQRLNVTITKPLPQVGEGTILRQYIKEELEAYLEEQEKNNPWAICTASVGREDKEKYERCVKSVKTKNRGK